MKKFKLFFFVFALFLLFNGCSSSNDSSIKKSKADVKICPQCNMELSSSNIHSALINDNNTIRYFDDIGCMILWSHKKGIDLRIIDTKVFTNDTKKYIQASKAYYKLSGNTPMQYGFSAYEMDKENSIDLNEVIIKMLRGEHMANPKIRKQILG